MNLLIQNKRITDKMVAIQILTVHIYSGNLMVMIRGIIVDTFVRIATGGINGNFVFSFLYLAAAPLLIHAAKNVKELTDTFFF
jgi:hypothetical protein